MCLFKFLLPLAAITGLAVQAQVPLQNFSSVVGPLTYFYGTWEATGDVIGTTNKNSQFVQGVGVFDFTGTGVTNSADSRVEFFNAAPVSIGSFALLQVSAQSLSGNAASSFAVILFDTTGKQASATFATSVFTTGSYTSALGSLTFQSGFNPAQIDSMVISGAQLGGLDTFKVSFDDVSAVPEPATYAVLSGIAALGVAWLARRRRASVAQPGHLG